MVGLIRIGDVVTLCSGGPEMVVVHTSLTGQISVAWIDTRGQARRNVFPSLALQVVSVEDV